MNTVISHRSYGNLLQRRCFWDRVVRQVTEMMNLPKTFDAAQAAAIKQYNDVTTLPTSFDIEPITIFSGKSSLIKNWKSFDDRSYKGKSIGQVSVIKYTSTAIESHKPLSSESVSNDKKDELISTNTAQDIINFSGEIKFDEEIEKITKAKGSFCACKGELAKRLDLRDYEGISFTIRSLNSNLAFVLNMQCESQFEGDLYQLDLEVPQNKWCTFHIPFHLFKLTANGVERESQRSNDSLQVKAFGLLVDSASDSNFTLQIKEITALSTIDSKVLKKTLRTKEIFD